MSDYPTLQEEIFSLFPTFPPVEKGGISLEEMPEPADVSNETTKTKPVPWFSPRGYYRSRLVTVNPKGQAWINRQYTDDVNMIRMVFRQSKATDWNHYIIYPWADQSYYLPVQQPFFNEGAEFFIEGYMGKKGVASVSVVIDPDA